MSVTTLHSASEQRGFQRRLQYWAWLLCKWFTLECKWGWSHRCLFGLTAPSRVNPTQASPLAPIGLCTNTSDVRSLPNMFAWGKWSHPLLGFVMGFSKDFLSLFCFPQPMKMMNLVEPEVCMGQALILYEPTACTITLCTAVHSGHWWILQLLNCSACALSCSFTERTPPPILRIVICGKQLPFKKPTSLLGVLDFVNNLSKDFNRWTSPTMKYKWFFYLALLLPCTKRSFYLALLQSRTFYKRFF